MGGCAEVNDARVRRTEARSGDMAVEDMFVGRNRFEGCYNGFLTGMMFMWVVVRAGRRMWKGIVV